MNKQFKLSILAFTLLGALSANSFAQSTDVANPNQTINLGQANAFEKEVTPLLREISLKKSLLELRKVERELEKLDEEALKAQVEREALLNQNNEKAAFGPGPMGGIQVPGIPTFGGGTAPQMMPQTSAPVAASTEKAVDNAIRVLMIYGFTNNLYAKVATGAQGGFVVKEGDVLPDGRLVKNITANYLEVQNDNNGKKTKNKSKIDKIFVSYTPSPEVANNTSNMPIFKPNAPNITQPIPSMMPAPMLSPIR